MIPVPSSSLRVKKKVFPPLSHFCQLLSLFVNFHSWPHLARARQAGARSWQWPHLGLASEIIKSFKQTGRRGGEKGLVSKMIKFITKVSKAADRSPVEVDEPGCVPVENALLELSAVGKLVFVQNFWIVAVKNSWADENAQQYSILASPQYIMSSISYR